jgi:hypothetical protein
VTWLSYWVGIGSIDGDLLVAFCKRVGREAGVPLMDL